MHRLGLFGIGSLAGLALIIGCGDSKKPLFEPKPECEGQSVVALQGQHQMIISKLNVGSVDDGFDLDGDGEPDNKLAAVSSLARPAIEDAFEDNSILIPLEFFDFETVGEDDCVKFAIYVGEFEADEEDDCTPYDGSLDCPVTLDPIGMNPDGSPKIAFTSGTVTNVGGKLLLEAGPALFSVSIPVTAGLDLELRLTGVSIEGELEMTASGWRIINGRLGGVIDARTADSIRGLDVEQIGLNPEDSLLDAVFANILGPILALPTLDVSDDSEWAGCRTPDIDVDQDGLEAFCDSDPLDERQTVDVCIDGDGTVVWDEYDANGEVVWQCTDATDSKGEYRFVDGISVALVFETMPVALLPAP
jgi:hypothetical protein